MKLFTEKMAKLAEELRAERKQVSKEFGDVKIADVTAGQVVGGMRGLISITCDTSSVLPDEGLRIRNIPIIDLKDAMPEDIFYLLCTGEFPNEEERAEIRASFAEHANVPNYVWRTLEALPPDSHPMAMLSIGLMALERESKFRKAYDAGTGKDQLWKSMLVDSVEMLGKISTLAAGIYRLRFNKGDRIAPRKDLDWGANFTYMLGLDDPNGELTKLIRMYLVLHSDHGAGNVSAFTSNVVSSALSDIYYSLSAGLNGLAGPLHGLANQECLAFVQKVQAHFGGIPSKEDMTKFVWDHLNSGQVVPGYGHAVLRVEDPRFTAFYQFGKEYCPEAETLKFVEALYAVVPDILKEQGKAKSVYPNVDAASGALLWHYGMTEYDFYTVMFAVSRAMGIASQQILNRAAMTSIIRPKAMSMKKLKAAIAEANQ